MNIGLVRLLIRLQPMFHHAG